MGGCGRGEGGAFGSASQSMLVWILLRDRSCSALQNMFFEVCAESCCLSFSFAEPLSSVDTLRDVSCSKEFWQSRERAADENLDGPYLLWTTPVNMRMVVAANLAHISKPLVRSRPEARVFHFFAPEHAEVEQYVAHSIAKQILDHWHLPEVRTSWVLRSPRCAKGRQGRAKLSREDVDLVGSNHGQAQLGVPRVQIRETHRERISRALADRGGLHAASTSRGNAQRFPRTTRGPNLTNDGKDPVRLQE